MSEYHELDVGLVVAGHGRHFIVETPEGERLICHPRGKKSDAVVGDRVRWQPTAGIATVAGPPQDGGAPPRGAAAARRLGADMQGVIEHIEPRRNLMFRQDEWRTKSFASNLDQLLVLVAGKPVFSESQLARALIAAEAAGIPARIVLNKIDLPEADAARERLQPYRAMGLDVVELALKARPDESRERLRALLGGQTTLVLGPSGAGKSTLINLMVPDAAAQVGDISQALNSGRHTTTTTQWYWLDDGRTGALIDSPGFQEFGLRQIEAQQLAGLMPDFREPATRCRFYNCTHRQEPGCGVLEAVKQGTVSASRHRIYAEIFEELSRTKW